MLKITCCKDCTRRQLGCHATCKDYIKQRKELTNAVNTFNEQQRRIVLCKHDFEQCKPK